MGGWMNGWGEEHTDTYVTHLYTCNIFYTHTHIYIYIYTCVCVCAACVHSQIDTG